MYNNNIYIYMSNKKLFISTNWIKEIIKNDETNILYDIIENKYYNFVIDKDLIIVIIEDFTYNFFKIENEESYMSTCIEGEMYYKNKLDFISNNKNINNIYNSWFGDIRNCCFITGIETGESIKYINDIIINYENKNNFIKIKKNYELNAINFKKKDIIILQYFFNTDINITDIIKICKMYDLYLIITIHDFYWIDDKIKYIIEEPLTWEYNYIYDNININTDIKELFNFANEVICPSKYVYSIYDKYFKIKQLKWVYYNDYNINNIPIYIPRICNNKINIGNFNIFCYCNGKNIIEYLKQKYKTYKNYEINFYICGLNIEDFSENEYYNILNKYNIHCLTFINNYSEKYCYRLTKALNSGLSIIYNNIGAIEERIGERMNEEYNNHYFKINNTENLINLENTELSFTKLLDYIIENNGKYNKCNFNNNDIIQYNYYYEKLFKYKIKYNIVFITSKIYVSEYPLSYIPNRSIYTKDERYLQVINTINTIKKKIPNYYIMLFDNSIFSKKEYNILNNMVNRFINITDNTELNYYTNQCELKSLAELYQLKYIFKNFNVKIRINNIFKITGRYCLNDNFNYNTYDNKYNIFKKNNDLKNINYYYTCFYKIHYNYIDKYKNNIDNCINKIKNIEKYKYYDLEVIFPLEFNYDFKDVDELGLTSNIAVWKDNSNI